MDLPKCSDDEFKAPQEEEGTIAQKKKCEYANDIQDVEQISHTMKALVLTTDQVTSRVEKSSVASREADNWSSLAAAIEDDFRSGDSHTIAVRLKSMQNSLEILKGSPDYDDKLKHLEALKNRLESHVSPQAVAAFTQHNTEQAKKLQIVFSTIDRETELHKCYVNTYCSNLTTRWQAIVANEDDKSIMAVLHELYNLLITTWRSQLPWCGSVFGPVNATSILIQLLIQMMRTSKPGFKDVITTALKIPDYPKLMILSALHMVATRFSRSLEEVVTDACGASPTSTIDPKLLESLADALWMPYAPFQMDFKALATEMLLTKLRDEVLVDAGNLIYLTRDLAVTVDKVFMIASQAYGQCVRLTDFLGAHALISSLNSFFHKYTRMIGEALQINFNDITPNESDTPHWGISVEHYYSMFKHSSKFQYSLRIILTCGKLLQAYLQLEELLIEHILHSHGANVALAGDDIPIDDAISPWLRYNYLKKTDLKEYKKLQDMLLDLKRTAPSQRALLPEVKQSLTSLNQQAHQIAFDIEFAQIKKQLDLIPQLEIWTQANTAGTELVHKADLPPTEYATTIGHHLKTLPQHLETFAAEISEDDEALSAMKTALQAAKLRFSENSGDNTELVNMAGRWLTSIVKSTEHMYVQACLQIPSLTPRAARQLAVDLEYIGNIVVSLGLPILEDITMLTKLLRAPEENYSNVAMDAPKELTSSVARIRGIKDLSSG